VALENAASIAGMLLTTKCVFIFLLRYAIESPPDFLHIKEPEPAALANPGMGGMGGMY